MHLLWTPPGADEILGTVMPLSMDQPRDQEGYQVLLKLRIKEMVERASPEEMRAAARIMAPWGVDLVGVRPMEAARRVVEDHDALLMQVSPDPEAFKTRKPQDLEDRLMEISLREFLDQLMAE